MTERVVHLVPALFGRDGGIVGGAERYAYELARHMAEYRPTTLVSFGPTPRVEVVGRLEIRVLGPARFIRGQVGNPLAPGLFRALRGASIVHCHQQHVIASSLAALYCRLTRRRVVVSDLGGGGWDVSGYVSTDRWYHAHLHISAYGRRVSGHEGRPWAHVIYGGVDAERFSPARDGRQEHVLFVGRLLPHKGVDVLIEAMPEGLPLRILGVEGDERYVRDLERLAEGRRVSFERTATDDALLDAYRHALCIVLPSVYRSRYGDETRVPELLGQTLLEGMACGIPAVATDVASLPEVVDHGRTGLLVPPNAPGDLGSALGWLRDHPDKARDMGKRARADVCNRFDWNAVVDRCLTLYRDTT